MIPWNASPSRLTYSRIPTSVSIGGRSVSALPSSGRWRPKRKVEGGRSDFEAGWGVVAGAGGSVCAGESVLTFLTVDVAGDGDRVRLALVVPLGAAEEGVVSSIVGLD